MAPIARLLRYAPPAALVAASCGLLAVRVYASATVGFGDSEALYASYALHPAPAYLDHPGLVGILAGVIGAGTSPSPGRAHLVTAALATAFPWLMGLACRACGADWKRSLSAALVVALVPEIAIGLFALTPDLLLALLWTSALGLAAAGLQSAPGSGRATAAFAAAGLLSGVGAASKLTGLALMAALAATYASPQARHHARSLAPWAGLAAGVVVLAPVIAFEQHTGWPMLRHRFVDTQADAGLSLRNAGALLGGQIVYLSPVVAWLAVVGARQAWRDRRDAVGRLLWTAFVAPLALTAALCLWSRVAEPHWIAPALLALAPAAARGARSGEPSARLVTSACAVAGALVLAVHAWVLVPAAVRLAPTSYDPRLDLGNELYGWPDVVSAVRDEARRVAPPSGLAGDDLAVVGPHWVICAQLEAALRGELHVGCNTPVRDDFDDWFPRARWRRSRVLLSVGDGRFDPLSFPEYSLVGVRQVRVERAGRTVRVFSISVLARQREA
jgi:hypothetical protein